MVKILKYDNPYHKIKLTIRQIQVLDKSTGQINNTGYEWYIGSHHHHHNLFNTLRVYTLKNFKLKGTRNPKYS